MDELSAKPIAIWRHPRKWVLRVLSLNDTPHAKALGMAIGVFIAMTPTVGLQIVIVLTLALLTGRLFYFNKPAALLMVYVSNPLTILPIYWTDYKIGTLFFKGNLTREMLANVLKYEGFEQWWQALVTLFVEIGRPMLAGSLILGSGCGLATYLITRWFLKTNGPVPNPSTEQDQV
ncbi:DUF2062 domain-containing protein [Thalassoroseus pseudoceratinae]|uniref:DUF2062 domain-containing protein n=1 Tax=Thalassoroseus pseudoceratinae TaxID=2713176 RepID=UPI00142243E3|nr:DUF2062 domain-containing protein [Thalassoroseus pseudoceratinae]